MSSAMIEEEIIPRPDRILGLRDGALEGKRIKLYDFRRPDKFSKEQIRTMQNITETFTRIASTRLSAALRLPCELSVEMVDQMTYSEFMDPLAAPATLAVVSMEPLKGQAVMHIDAAGTDAIIERVFGATPSVTAEPLASGCITDIEISQVERILVAIIEDLGEAWNFVPGIKPKLIQLELEARFCQIVPPTEMIVLTTCALKVGAVKGSLNIVYPFLVLEPIIHMLSAKYWYERRGQEISAPSLAAARRAPMPVEIMRDAGALSIDALRSMRRGTVIELPETGETQAWLRLGGMRVAELSALTTDKRSVTAAFAGHVAPKSTGDPDGDTLARLATELKTGFESIRTGVSDAMINMAHRIDELKGGQEDLSDRVLFGQADAAGARPSDKPFASLAGVPAEPFALFLSSERPQVCALVLSVLDDAFGARLLSLLPVAVQPEVTRRIATMDWVTPQVLAGLEHVLAKKLSAIEKAGFEPGGIKKIVGILNFSPRETERLVITALDTIDPGLSESIKRNMFVFEDIVILDDESIAAVLEAAEERDIVTAMKPVSEEMRERLFARFPAARRERLRTALKELGRMKLSECDAAGFRVVEIIRRLEEEGRIAILRAGE